MADDRIQRAIEFILQQQAQQQAQQAQQQAEYAARLERDAPRLASLEESFKMLVELARITDERQDTMGEAMATLSHTMNELVQSTITDGSRRARLEESFTMLVELARRADERLDGHDARFEMDAPRFARLEESFKMLAELAHRHG